MNVAAGSFMRDEATLRSEALGAGQQAVSPLVECGRLIDEKFIIQSLIGSGGMADVMLARDIVLDRDVALKFLGKDLLADPTWRERFIAEAKNMARVQHENVMQIHSFGVHAGCPYFVMDYVAGGNLAQWRRVNAKPRLDFVAGLVRQIAAGLDAIHAASLVHHDVKPANILMNRDGRVVLTDLGLSRLVVSGRGVPLSAGTPRYMAPEQISNVTLPPELAPRTDVYQLGVTTLHLLLGAAALDAFTGTIATRNVQWSRAGRSAFGEAVERVLQIAIATDPQDRFESAGAFALALSEAVTMTSGSGSVRPQEPLRILVADDDPDQLGICCRLLVDALPFGTRVESVTDGELALSAIRESSFDVVLLDLHMPRMSGFDVASALSLSSGPMPRLIAMTAAGGSEDWRALRPLGVEALLLKPFDAEQLIALVARNPSAPSPRTSGLPQAEVELVDSAR